MVQQTQIVTQKEIVMNHDMDYEYPVEDAFCDFCGCSTHKLYLTSGYGYLLCRTCYDNYTETDIRNDIDEE